ncbi:enoyl-CoA hydratase/isomerase [Cellulosilyticum ruminicola]|uniref:enoyl-CoA hydratase/isomerase n=1 Tax=Cellulosilyticum ruminicola TaxID=425254 RepID=UPI0006D002C3|nr:enoyl-CoA hydratase/isomerase [Cellulosilyticum ruminicola]
MELQTIEVKKQDKVCFLKFNRPQANNTINDILVEECYRIIEMYENEISILVLEGADEVFCFGADFKDKKQKNQPEKLYRLWTKLATGSFITIAHVRGKANAGGLGFVAASDIVIADTTATFSLSEMLFGLFPAMVLPFLIRRMGYRQANFLTLTTKTISVKQACDWGLVDEYQEKSHLLLMKYISRLKKIPKSGIINYKHYINEINTTIIDSESDAIRANKKIFADESNKERIRRFVEDGIYPWEE